MVVNSLTAEEIVILKKAAEPTVRLLRQIAEQERITASLQNRLVELQGQVPELETEYRAGLSEVLAALGMYENSNIHTDHKLEALNELRQNIRVLTDQVEAASKMLSDMERKL